MRSHLVQVDLQDFLNHLPNEQQNLVQEDLLPAFIVSYQHAGDSLIKFLMEYCARRPFDEFINIAIILKNLINELHNMGFAQRVQRMIAINSLPTAQAPPIFPPELMVLNNALTAAERMQALIPLIRNFQIMYAAEIPYQPTIPSDPIANSWPSNIFQHALNILRNVYSIAAFIAYAVLYAESRVDGNPMLLKVSFFVATLGNLLAASGGLNFFTPPHILINCLAFPPEYRPKASDSPGMTAYKEVLRHIHVILYINKNNDATMFAGNLQEWLINRDIQWRNYQYRLPGLIIGSVVAAPAILPLLAFKYQRTKNDFVLYQQTQNLNAPTTNKLPYEALIGIFDLVIFSSASCIALDIIHASSIIDDDNDPTLYHGSSYNETVRRYLHIYASTMLGFAALIVCHEVPPRVTKMLQQAPATIQNVVTSVSHTLAGYIGLTGMAAVDTATSVSNTVSSVMGYIWPRARAVVRHPNGVDQDHRARMQNR